MAFPKRGTRKLTVEGRSFLWHISPKDVEYGGVATIRAEEGSAVLHYWQADGFPSPAEAARVIEFALEHGWAERRSGPNCWVGRNHDGYYLSHERVPAPWEERSEPLPRYPTGGVSREAGERRSNEGSPFADLQVPSILEPPPDDLLERWVLPIYQRRFDARVWAEPLRARLTELSRDVVSELLSYRDWRTRLAGGYLAAIGGFSSLEEQIGRLLLRNEHHYVVRSYALALTSFNTPRSRWFMTTYLDRYLGSEELGFDQREVMAGVMHLDRLNDTNVSGRFRARCDREWSSEGFEQVLEVLGELGRGLEADPIR